MPQFGRFTEQTQKDLAEHKAKQPIEYIVRLWVDVKIPASTRKEAMEKASKLGHTTIEGAEIYDEQIADAWPH